MPVKATRSGQMFYVILFTENVPKSDPNIPKHPLFTELGWIWEGN